MLLAACSRGSTRSAPQPTSVQPSAAYTSADVPVAILGEHFEPRAVQQVGRGGAVQVDATFRAFLGASELNNVRWEAPDRLTATVPAGLFGGPYDLHVLGPTGEGVLAAAFRGSSARPATLTAAITAPGRVELGTQFGVDFFVGNNGEVAVEGPAMQLMGYPGLAIVTVPGAPQAFQPGQTVHYVALISAVSRGLSQLMVQATGLDGFTGSTLTAVASTSVQVLAPPVLAAQPAPAPATVSVGQKFDLAVDISNSGDLNAVGLTFAALRVSGPGAIVSGPPPAPQDVPVGGTRTFHFAVQAASPGLVTAAVSGVASDPMSGLPVALEVAWNPILVQTPAQLVASWLQLPGSVAPGQSFAVSLAVTNNGQAPARSVALTPDPPSVQPSGAAGGTPAGASAAIGGGGTQVFTWTFTASAPLGSTFQLSAGATGADENSGASVSAASVTSPPVAVQNLSAAFSVAPAILRGDTFKVVLQVGNAGMAAVIGVTPSALSVTGGVSCGTVSPPSADLAALTGSVAFTWPCTANTSGAVQLGASVSGTESGSNAPRTASASARTTVTETLAIASDPLGDGAAAASVFGFAGRVYVGPRKNGAGAVRFQPDGSGREAVSFSFAEEATDQNQATGPYPSLGYAGCATNTLQCGPDNEDGRGFFGSVTIAGAPWLVAGGARSVGKISHVYASTDSGPAASFSYVLLKFVLGPSERTTTVMTEFGNLLILGFGGKGPMLLALNTMPSPPGEEAIWGVTGFDLAAYNIPGIATGAQIDAARGFGGRLHVFNSGGCARANGADVTASNLGWLSCTPSAAAYASKASLTTQKTAGLTPADYAFPAVVPYGGRLYAARNTVAGPQLWACTPGADGLCDPGDWSLVAPNGSGDTQLTQFDDPGNSAITMLAATPTHLYVGFDNAGGVGVFRSALAAPASRGDFERVGPPGLGLSATRIFDAKALVFPGNQSVYATVGDGVSPLSLVRLVE